MKLRRKILALSGVLLAILCAALFVSLRLQREVHDEIAAGRDYHLPLGALLAEAEGARRSAISSISPRRPGARPTPTWP